MLFLEQVTYGTTATILTSFSISASSKPPPRLLCNDVVATRLVAVKAGVAGVKAAAEAAKAPSAMTEVVLICILIVVVYNECS